MFTMTVEKQMDLADRTLILGKPSFDIIPKRIQSKYSIIDVKGVSNGVAPPFVSLEIDKINQNIVGQTIQEYNN